MSTITAIRTISITVADQAASVDFYTNTLGFDVRLDAAIGPDLRWIEIAPAGADVSLALDRGIVDGPADSGVRFTVPDAEVEHAALAALGVAVGEVLRWEGVPAMFTFDDPDGNRFYVVEDRS